MAAKSEQFKQEVTALIARYDGRYREGESRDQEENVIAETEYVVVDGQYFTLGDFFEDR